MTATEIEPYAGGQLEQYQARMVMTPDQARALDEQVRRCTEAVLQEGTDYGIIPGTNGEKTLWRPGAQKLLQWFGLGYDCQRVEVERDEETGRKHGITYRAVVGRRLPDGTIDVKATCEGTADYDESKFWQSAEDVQEKAERNERKWAKKDGRVADPTKWKNRGEYRADWNALMKRAQKRAIVGAVVDATAAGGIFTTREEDDRAPAPQNDGPTWYESAIDRALTSTDIEAGGELQALFVGAAQAHRENLISRRQQDHVQNTVRQRLALLKKATVVVEVEDLADKIAAEAGQDAAEDSQEPAQDTPAVEDPPGWPEAAKPGTGQPKGR